MEDRVRILMTLADGDAKHGQSKNGRLYEIHAKELKIAGAADPQMLLEAGNV
jgi:hypothetical protein